MMTSISNSNSSSSVSTADTSSIHNPNPNPPPPQSPRNAPRHHHHQIGGAAPRPPLPPRAPRVGVGGGGRGQNQACAACKYQRRKCNPDCPLARYFPADEQRRFMNAHRLFGVSNIQKTLQRTPPELHADAMRALTFEADARAADPVGGAARLVAELGRQFDVACAELAAVHHQIKLHQAAANVVIAAAADDDNPIMAEPMLFAGGGGDSSGQNDDAAAMIDSFYVAGEGSNGGGGFQEEQYLVKDEGELQPPQAAAPQPYECGLYYGTAAAGDEGSSHAWTSGDNVQHKCGNGGEATPPMVLSDQLRQHCQIEAAPPFVQAFDVKPELTTTTTTMERHVNGGLIVGQPETKVLAVAGSSSPAAAAAARCQLELGCSSF